jgi:hypothetical protein
MASENKKAKTAPAPKSEPASKTSAAPKNEAAAAEKTASGTDSAKTGSGDAAASPSANYSRGEGQKPVSDAYRDNWNVIFAKKKKR